MVRFRVFKLWFGNASPGPIFETESEGRDYIDGQIKRSRPFVTLQLHKLIGPERVLSDKVYTKQGVGD